MLKRTNIYLKQKTINKLKREAERRSTSMSQIIRNIVEEFSKKEIKEPKESAAESLLRMAEEAEKKNLKSGIKNLSKKVDYYLYGPGRKK